MNTTGASGKTVHKGAGTKDGGTFTNRPWLDGGTLNMAAAAPISGRYSSPPVDGAETGALVTMNGLRMYDDAGILYPETKFVIIDTLDYLNDNEEECRAYRLADDEWKRTLDVDGEFSPEMDSRWSASSEFEVVVPVHGAGASAEADPVGMPQRNTVPMPELNRVRRGQKFFLADHKKWPTLGATEDVPVADKKIVGHYFGGSVDIYIAEYDPVTYTAFGYTDVGRGGEWGNIDMQEIERFNQGYFVIERDAHFTKGTLAEVSRH